VFWIVFCAALYVVATRSSSIARRLRSSRPEPLGDEVEAWLRNGK
jgi:hypothetical protein